MAFEDRCSPNSGANSPNSNNNSLSVPNSPESTRTSPYTCLTVSPEKRQGVTNNNNFMRITSFALPSSPKSPEGNMEHSLRSDSPVSSRNTPSPCESIMSSSSMRSRSPDEEPRIQTLKYSIVNILQPDFGKTALKTRISSSSTNKISFKPYARLTSENNKYHNISNEDVKPSLLTPPLGSLCQTVSQIGANLSLGISAKKTLDSPLLGLRKNSSVTTETCLIGGSKTVEEKKDAALPVAANNFPAWVYCTRYSDRPSSGPRSRRMKKQEKANEEKRPRTAFSSAQLQRLKQEFNENRYLTEHRRQKLSSELGLNEAQIKIWFQNKRAKQKKSSGEKNPLALQLMAQGLYNHSTVACDEDEMMSLQN